VSEHIAFVRGRTETKVKVRVKAEGGPEQSQLKPATAIQNGNHPAKNGNLLSADHVITGSLRLRLRDNWRIRSYYLG